MGKKEEDMITLISIPDSVKRAKHEVKSFFGFLQMMANRIGVGGIRYGRVKAEQTYWTRLLKEVEAYRKTGNGEYLVNIANYCWLESYAPEHGKFHWDNTVGSATRNK